MAIVTLTTDLGYRDPYLALVKVKLSSQSLFNNSLKIIDLSCDVKKHFLNEAAFILKHALPFFPKGTVHLMAVKDAGGAYSKNLANRIDNTRYLLTTYQDQFIISPDNGLLTLIDKNFDEPVYQIYFDEEAKHQFYLKDIFVETVHKLLQNIPPQNIGLATSDYYKTYDFEPFVNVNVNGSILRGKAVYADDFGNIITNISQTLFLETKNNNTFEIYLPGEKIKTISQTYDDAEEGSPLALFNNFGLLEIAINGGNAYKMLCKREVGKPVDFEVIIEFNR
jgi:S-adenosyl-L-methionine hydrolase (adenosine-forming)